MYKTFIVTMLKLFKSFKLVLQKKLSSLHSPVLLSKRDQFFLREKKYVFFKETIIFKN